MLSAFVRAFRTPDLRRKLLFTIGIMVVFRIGSFLPTPGVSYPNVQICIGQAEGQNSLLGLVNLFSGGALLQLSVFALGIMPYISSSIILQLLTVVWPYLEKLSKEGEMGRKKITQYTRYGTVLLSFIQASGIALWLEKQTAPGGAPLVPNPGWGFRLMTVLTLTTGTIFIMWLGEQITERGIGNGISLIIFAGIIAGMPDGIIQLWARGQSGNFDLLTAVLLIGIWLGELKELVPEGPNQEWAVLGYKLLIHVGIPVAIIMSLGGAIRPLFDSGLNRKGFWTTLIVLSAMMMGLLAVVSPSLKQISALNLDPAWTLFWVIASWAWLSIEAGLCEEFLFRACIQSRFTAWLSSPVAGIALTSVLFGLAHAPGLYFRGGPGVDGWSTDPLQVIAFTISTLAPLSLFFGFVYARTKSLLLVVLLHACVDVLPFTAPFVRTWLS